MLLDQRDKAWAIRAYPTIGLGYYLDPPLPKHPHYRSVISRLQREEILFLEIGTMLGSDLRALVADGAPSEKLIAADIVNFWELGYEMFRDQDSFHCKYIQTDVMDRSGPLLQFRHAVDIIYISQVLHQWDFEKQVEVCQTLVDLSKPGCWIIGNQIGYGSGRAIKLFDDMPAQWIHDIDTWRQLWTRVERDTGTKWDTETALMSFSNLGMDQGSASFLGDDAMFIVFTVRRIA